MTALLRPPSLPFPASLKTTHDAAGTKATADRFHGCLAHFYSPDINHAQSPLFLLFSPMWCLGGGTAGTVDAVPPAPQLSKGAALLPACLFISDKLKVES